MAGKASLLFWVQYSLTHTHQGSNTLLTTSEIIQMISGHLFKVSRLTLDIIQAIKGRCNGRMPTHPKSSMPLVLSQRTMPQLPSDVWAIISRWLALSHGALSLKAASLISRTIGYEADRYLWGNLKVESLGALVTLSRMVLARARISPHLSTLCVQSTAPNYIQLGPMELIQIKQALTQCTKLSVLELCPGPGDSGIELMRGLHIPTLRAFSTDLPVDEHLLMFLEMHPAIQELHIGSEMVAGTTPFIHECMLPNLWVLEAPLALAAVLLPYRPVSHLKVWASYGLTQDMAIADALRLIGCMRLSTARIVSFRFEDGPPYTPTIHQYGAEFSQHMKLLGLLFIDREEEDQAIQLAQLAPGLQVIQFDNAMANQRTNLEQRDFVLRLGQVFKSLWLVSFEDDYQKTYWARLKNNKWIRQASVPLDLWRNI